MNFLCFLISIVNTVYCADFAEKGTQEEHTHIYAQTVSTVIYIKYIDLLKLFCSPRMIFPDNNHLNKPSNNISLHLAQKKTQIHRTNSHTVARASQRLNLRSENHGKPRHTSAEFSLVQEVLCPAGKLRYQGKSVHLP